LSGKQRNWHGMGKLGFSQVQDRILGFPELDAPPGASIGEVVLHGY